MVHVEGEKKYLTGQIYDLILDFLFSSNIVDDILWPNLGMTAGQLGNSVGSAVFWGLEHFVLAKVR